MKFNVWILYCEKQKDMFSGQLLNGWLHLFLEHNLSFAHAGILGYFTSQFLWKNEKKYMYKQVSGVSFFTMFDEISLKYFIWLHGGKKAS